MPAQNESLLWDVRTFVYQRFAAKAQPPTVDETAAHFGLTHQAASDVFRALDAQHAFFLEPGRLQIRMANPFSAVATPFRVHVDQRTYWANCAWDALGIPAALHSDATIDATYADGEEALQLTVRSGAISGQSAHEATVAHLLVPFQRWYEDMNFT